MIILEINLVSSNFGESCALETHLPIFSVNHYGFSTVAWAIDEANVLIGIIVRRIATALPLPATTSSDY